MHRTLPGRPGDAPRDCCRHHRRPRAPACLGGERPRRPARRHPPAGPALGRRPGRPGRRGARRREPRLGGGAARVPGRRSGRGLRAAPGVGRVPRHARAGREPGRAGLLDVVRGPVVGRGDDRGRHTATDRRRRGRRRAAGPDARAASSPPRASSGSRPSCRTTPTTSSASTHCSSRCPSRPTPPSCSTSPAAGHANAARNARPSPTARGCARTGAAAPATTPRFVLVRGDGRVRQPHRRGLGRCTPPGPATTARSRSAATTTPGLLGGGELLLLGRGAPGARGVLHQPVGVRRRGASASTGSPAGSTPGCAPARSTRARPGPVALNTWEAVYFDHDLGRLTALADAAAAVGAERFVLDDGWFGARRDDSRGAGGLVRVRRRVAATACTRWSTTSPGSAWSSASGWSPRWSTPTPTWPARTPTGCCGCRHRLPPEAGTSRCWTSAVPEAYAYILERLDALLTEYHIGYLKWDHNRDLVDAGHAGAAGRARADARGLPAARRAARAAPRRGDRVLLVRRRAGRPGDPAAHRPGVGQRLHRRATSGSRSSGGPTC